VCVRRLAVECVTSGYDAVHRETKVQTSMHQEL
jgi:hypothetical protein